MCEASALIVSQCSIYLESLGLSGENYSVRLVWVLLLHFQPTRRGKVGTRDKRTVASTTTCCTHTCGYNRIQLICDTRPIVQTEIVHTAEMRPIQKWMTHSGKRIQKKKDRYLQLVYCFDEIQFRATSAVTDFADIIFSWLYLVRCICVKVWIATIFSAFSSIIVVNTVYWDVIHLFSPHQTILMDHTRHTI